MLNKNLLIDNKDTHESMFVLSAHWNMIYTTRFIVTIEGYIFTYLNNKASLITVFFIVDNDKKTIFVEKRKNSMSI
jgi:hypothetical protein